MSNIQEELQKYQDELDRQESIEHRDVLLAIAAVFKSKEGLKIFEYLFKNLEVNTLPEQGMQGNELFEYLGFLRAGLSIYKLACEADSETAAQISAKLERKRYEHLYNKHRIENGFYSKFDSDE